MQRERTDAAMRARIPPSAVTAVDELGAMPTTSLILTIRAGRRCDADCKWPAVKRGESLHLSALKWRQALGAVPTATYMAVRSGALSPRAKVVRVQRGLFCIFPRQVVVTYSMNSLPIASIRSQQGCAKPCLTVIQNKVQTQGDPELQNGRWQKGRNAGHIIFRGKPPERPCGLSRDGELYMYNKSAPSRRAFG